MVNSNSSTSPRSREQTRTTRLLSPEVLGPLRAPVSSGAPLSRRLGPPVNRLVFSAAIKPNQHSGQRELASPPLDSSGPKDLRRVASSVVPKASRLPPSLTSETSSSLLKIPQIPPRDFLAARPSPPQPLGPATLAVEASSEEAPRQTLRSPPRQDCSAQALRQRIQALLQADSLEAIQLEALGQPQLQLPNSNSKLLFLEIKELHNQPNRLYSEMPRNLLPKLVDCLEDRLKLLLSSSPSPRSSRASSPSRTRACSASLRLNNLCNSSSSNLWDSQ